MQLSNTQISLGAVAAALVVIGPSVWNGMSWAVELESQVAENAKAINTMILKFDKRDEDRDTERQVTNALARDLIERMDRLVKSQENDTDGT
jgi:hypothetical protein